MCHFPQLLLGSPLVPRLVPRPSLSLARPNMTLLTPQATLSGLRLPSRASCRKSGRARKDSRVESTTSEAGNRETVAATTLAPQHIDSRLVVPPNLSHHPSSHFLVFSTHPSFRLS